jgi:hypothetical protein
MSRSLRFLGRLRNRLTYLGWRPDHPYYRAVEKAHNAVHAVTVHTFYASCKSGVCDGDKLARDDAAELWNGEGI